MPRANKARLHEGSAAQAVAVAEQVPVAPEEHHGRALQLQASLQVYVHGHVLDAREVGRAGRLRLLRPQGEGVAVDARVGDAGVRLVRLHEAVVRRLLHGHALGVVEVQAHGLERVAVVDAGEVEPRVHVLVALAAHGPDELDDRVVERHVEHVLAVVQLVLLALHLGHERVELRHAETVALVHVEVHVGDVEPRLQVGALQLAATAALDHGGRQVLADDAVLQALELHLDLHVGVHERHQGQGVAGRLSVPEGQRHVQHALSQRVQDQVVHGVTLTDHLSQALAGLARKLLPHEQVVVPQGRDGRVADHERRILNQQLADGVGPVSPVGPVHRPVGVHARLHAALVAVLRVLEVRVACVVVLFEPGGRRGIAVTSSLVVHHGVLNGTRVLGSRRELDEAVARSTGAGGHGAAADAGDLEHEVRVVDQITSLGDLENGGVTELHTGLRRLAQVFHGKVCVLVVARAPVRPLVRGVDEGVHAHRAPAQKDGRTQACRNSTTNVRHISKDFEESCEDCTSGYRRNQTCSLRRTNHVSCHVRPPH